MDERAKAMFDSNYYRKPMYDFLRATMQNRDILIDADLDETSIVLDVGAFDGDWAEKVSDRYYCNVHAFEPSVKFVERARVRLVDHPKVQVYEYGLTSSNQTARLSMAGPVMLTSLAPQVVVGSWMLAEGWPTP